MWVSWTGCPELSLSRGGWFFIAVSVRIASERSNFWLVLPGVTSDVFFFCQLDWQCDFFLLFSVHFLDTYILHIKFWWLLLWRLSHHWRTHCMVYVFEKVELQQWIICRCGEPVKRLTDAPHKLVDWLSVCHKPLKIEAQNGVLFIYLLAVLRTKLLSCQKWYHLI